MDFGVLPNHSFPGEGHGGEAVVGRRDAYWASVRSAVTNSLLLSILWAVGTFGADWNVQHWAYLDNQRVSVTRLSFNRLAPNKNGV